MAKADIKEWASKFANCQPIKNEKRIEKVEVQIRQGWPLLLKYDIDHFNVPRIWLIEKTGITRHRFESILRDKEATIYELAIITTAFNKFIAKIAEIDKNINEFEQNFLTDNQ